ncbi:MAG: hypothetical protein QF464_10965, partial [Myxococcota bacterium]|nr:hypothetical protein [Myxococcota bacterium]
MKTSLQIRSRRPSVSALGVGLAAALLLAVPANAQLNNTRLSAKGRALVKTTTARVESCHIVYKWDRCHGRRGPMDDLMDIGSNRRTRCIMS